MKLELLQKDCFYHIYNRGINSSIVFKNDENKSYFLRLIEKHLKDKVSIFTYCLMNNHYHFVTRVDVDSKIATQGISNLFNAYTKAYNKQQGRTGSLFENKFKRIKIHNEDYIKQLILYVHLNPRRHLNTDFENFKYSSYQTLIKKQESWINSKEVIDLFQDIDNFVFCHKKYDDELTHKFTFE